MAESDFVVTTAPGLEGEARRELRKLLQGADAEKLPFKGNLLLHSPRERGESLDILRQATTWCVASIVPIDAAAPVGKHEDELESLLTVLPWRQLFAERQTFVIRCRRRGQHAWDSRVLKRKLGLFIERHTEAIAQLTGQTDREVGVEVYQDVAYVGLYPPDQHLVKELRRRRKYPPGQRPLNRSEHKLREALRAFALQPQPTWRALDLGAAPGGWTKVLAQQVHHVVAVDPGDLDAEVARQANVRHLRCRAQDLDAEAVGPVDLIVNDMNIDGVESAALMVAVAPLLRDGAPAVMTVKFPDRRWRQHLRETAERLREGYKVVASRHLPHNRNETTLLLRRTATP
ncbi:MAG: SAM-dependent methyltransferase [Candidatus Brocadiia bacterium]